MSQIGIDSQELGFKILCYVIELAESGEIEQLIAAGFSSETISALRQMTVSDLNSLATNAFGMMALVINVPRFESAMAARSRRLNESQDLAYLAKAGATAILLSEIFRITLAEAEAHLATLTTEKRSGRPSMPDAATRDAIHQWWATNQSLPLRQRWIALHQNWPQFTLASLYAVINEFNV